MFLTERHQRSHVIPFSEMTEDQLLFETGLNRVTFSDILKNLRDLLHIHNTELALGIYLARLDVIILTNNWQFVGTLQGKQQVIIVN